MTECKLCLDDVSQETKVLYRLSSDGEFIDFDYCIDCLDNLMEQQWEKYIKDLRTADCEKSLLLLIHRGPPIRFRDACVSNNTEIHEFMHNGSIKSSKLNCPLDESVVRELHEKLSSIIVNSNKVENSANDFDYLGNISNMLKEYNL